MRGVGNRQSYELGVPAGIKRIRAGDQDQEEVRRDDALERCSYLLDSRTELPATSKLQLRRFSQQHTLIALWVIRSPASPQSLERKVTKTVILFCVVAATL